MAEKWDYPQPVTVAELDLEMLIARANLVPRVTPLPKYPAGLRDIAVVVPRALSAGELKRLIYEAGGGLVEQVTLFDLYEGAQIPRVCAALPLLSLTAIPIGPLPKPKSMLPRPGLRRRSLNWEQLCVVNGRKDNGASFTK